MKSSRKISRAVVLGVAVLFAVGSAHAQATVSVSATATGGFGDPNGCYTGLVPAFTFSGPQTVILTARGTISLDSPPFPATPKGVSVGPGYASYLFPLEEAVNDGGASPAIESSGPSINVGALMGAFVPAAVVSTAGFEAADEEIAGVGVPATSLFLVGSSVLKFVAPGAGTLYLGVNWSYACNALGSFSVTLTLPVEMQILPLGSGNHFSLSSAGLVPVAILSSHVFDARTVVPESVSLTASGVNLLGTSGPSDCREEDVNGDGLADLVCHVHMAQSFIEPGSSVAVLEGQTSEGIGIRGEDFVEIIAEE